MLGKLLLLGKFKLFALLVAGVVVPTAVVVNVVNHNTNTSVINGNKVAQDSQLSKTLGDETIAPSSTPAASTPVEEDLESRDSSPITLTKAKSLPTPSPSPSSAPASTSSGEVNNSPGTRPLHTHIEILNGVNVTVTPPGGSPHIGANGEYVEVGGTVATGADTRVQLVYPNGTLTRLDSNSSVTLKVEPEVAVGGDILINAGRTWQRVQKVLGVEGFQTESTTVIASVRGTSYGHSLDKNALGEPVDRILTIEGQVAAKCKLIPGDAEVLVDPNKTAELKCVVGQIKKLIDDIINMKKEDFDWIMYNTKIDLDVAGNLPPVVNAGSDKEITFSTTKTVNLAGSVTDDGLPFKKTYYIWNQMPPLMPLGIVNPMDLIKPNPKVTFISPGVYTFRLTATDNFIDYVTDDVTITVYGTSCTLLPPTTCSAVVPITNNTANFTQGLKAKAIRTDSLASTYDAASVTVVSPTKLIIIFNSILTKNKTYNLDLYYTATPLNPLGPGEVVMINAFNTN